MSQRRRRRRSCLLLLHNFIAYRQQHMLLLMLGCFLPQFSSSFVILPSTSIATLRTTRKHCCLGLQPPSAASAFLVDASISSLILGHNEHIGSFGSNANLLQSSFFWTPVIMLSIVGLLYMWEETIKQAKERTPPTLMPVVDSMLAEVSGLGFIGLFLSVLVTGGPLGNVVGQLSEEFLGEEEVLLESFEFLHSAFFEVGIVFFLIAGLVVSTVISKIESISLVSDAAIDTDRDGRVSLEELADILEVESVPVDLDGDGTLTEEEITNALRNSQKTAIWEEVRMSTQQVKAEALVVRERFLQTCNEELPDGFRIEVYFEKIFGENLEKIVELSPFSWLILVPFGALGVAVDWSNGVISASSPNAAAASGMFLAEPAFVTGFALYTIIVTGWGLLNFLKMTRMKEMLIPILVRDPTSNGKAILLPPRYDDDKLYQQYFDSNPYSLLEPAEKLYAEPARSRHEKLFGTIGAAGPDFYANSIKFHTWLVTVQIVFLGGQIAARDFDAIVLHRPALEVGNPDLVLPELLISSAVVVLAAAQLWLAPQTFLNYCLVTSIEALLDRDIIKEAGSGSTGGVSSSVVEVADPIS